MRKIHVTRQCFEAFSFQGHLFEKRKKKKLFYIWSGGVYEPNFRYESSVVWSGSVTQIDGWKEIHTCRNIPSAYSPAIDFENQFHQYSIHSIYKNL